MTTAASTELPAAERFSARINSDEGIAGVPDMQELSPLREKIGNKSRQKISPRTESETAAQPRRDQPVAGQNSPLVLGFDAWH
jgi:hypothetical protein